MWVGKNLMDVKLPIAPMVSLAPNEIAPLYQITSDFVDRAVRAGQIKVLIDGSTNDLTLDNTGWPFSPSACSHVYVPDAGGNVLTDTATDPQTGRVYRKTYTYASAEAGAAMLTESAWIKQ